MDAATPSHDAPLGELNLLTKWWFYMILFLAIYGFTVAVHLYFDYRQWCADREREELAQEAGSRSSPREKKDR
eukprot:CAMPEP_0179139720 /NCGR_PEP_ID=MMETSP0796-20121207/66851_1 /TAXON_ID=73915 /ORGANISM="Pyrodinium bahamense, Strain pbaha01" /LENGTH=72 /DNA_ID=CAMNT_0020839191 /DNA_START=24 /DNA_END=242 /DNA_ORIENTATION=+